MAKKLSLIEQAKRLVDILLNEHEDNLMPEVPDESKKSGEDIVKAVSDPTNPDVLQPIDIIDADIENELVTGEEPDSIEQSGKDMVKDIMEQTMNQKSAKPKTPQKSLGPADFNDYIETMKAKGFKDVGKIRGMIRRAQAIASRQGKGNDKRAILGIVQKFFQAK